MPNGNSEDPDWSVHPQRCMGRILQKKICLQAYADSEGPDQPAH